MIQYPTAMKKIFFILALVVGVAAHADYLYWMVGTPNPSTVQNFIGQNVDLSTWDNVKLIVDGTAIQSYTKDQIKSFTDIDAYAVNSIGTGYSSIMIELYQSDKYLAHSTDTMAVISQYIFSDNSMSATLGTGWTATAYAVPEPTSGLLFLVGGMLLGLKRRRQV